MPTVQIDGADHYHEIHGSGTPVLLLHGGFCSLEILRPQLDSLRTYSTVHAPERPGHGRTPDTDDPITYEQSVKDTIAYMDAVGLADAHIVGFSDGAIIGLLIALEHPTRIRSLVAISANLHPSGFVGGDAQDPQPEDQQPEDQQPDDQQAEGPQPQDQQAEDPQDPQPPTAELQSEATTSIYREHYAALSPDGPEHVEIVLGKLQHLWTHEPDIEPSRLRAIDVPALVMAGDRDVIRHEHTRLIASSIPEGQLCIVPDAGHDLMETRPGLVNKVVEEFISCISGNESARSVT